MLDDVDPRVLSAIKTAVSDAAPKPQLEWLTEKEAAAYLRLHPKTLRQWRTHNKGPPFYRIGPRSIRYRRVDLDAFVIQNHKDFTNVCPRKGN